MSDSDYKNLKRKIFERYLMDSPVVQGVQPLSFLVSDMYHFLKNANPTQDPTKIQTILKAWVADPNVNTIPQQMMVSFMNAGTYFGACNQTWLPITTNEFAILPFKNWYDAGKYGEKLIDGNVDLLVANDPFAAKLLEMHKASAAKVFANTEIATPKKFYDSYGMPIQAPVAVALPSIFDPFAEEMLQIPKNSTPNGYTYFPGLASRCNSIDSAEHAVLEEYIKDITNDTTLLIGGGANPGFDNATLAYVDVRNFQKDILANFYAGKISPFLSRLSSTKNDLSNKMTMLFNNHHYLFHYISYIVNKISDGKNSSVSHPTDKSYENALNTFALEIVRKFKDAVNTHNTTVGTPLPACKPMFLEILSCSTHDYCELLIDIEPTATESCKITPTTNPDILGIEYSKGKLFNTTSPISVKYSNKIYSILYTTIDTIVQNTINSMYKKTIGSDTYRIVTAMSFMQNGYRKYIKEVIGDDEYNKRQLEINHLIDGIGMTFDFIIIKINVDNTNSKLYGVRCH